MTVITQPFYFLIYDVIYGVFIPVGHRLIYGSEEDMYKDLPELEVDTNVRTTLVSNQGIITKHGFISKQGIAANYESHTNPTNKNEGHFNNRTSSSSMKGTHYPIGNDNIHKSGMRMKRQKFNKKTCKTPRSCTNAHLLADESTLDPAYLAQSSGQNPTQIDENGDRVVESNEQMGCYSDSQWSPGHRDKVIKRNSTKTRQRLRNRADNDESCGRRKEKKVQEEETCIIFGEKRKASLSSLRSNDIVSRRPRPEGWYVYDRTLGLVPQESSFLHSRKDQRNQGGFPLHRLQSDEAWDFYAGDGPIVLYQFDLGSGKITNVTIGINGGGSIPQYTVPANTWVGALLMKNTSWCLTGASNTPGFDPRDSQMAADSPALVDAFKKRFPNNVDLIERLVSF
eukprot:g1799.t1